MLTKTPARSDVGRIVDHGSFFERHQRRFDLAETLVDRVGQFVSVLVVELRAWHARR